MGMFQLEQDAEEDEEEGLLASTGRRFGATWQDMYVYFEALSPCRPVTQVSNHVHEAKGTFGVQEHVANSQTQLRKAILTPTSL